MDNRIEVTVTLGDKQLTLAGPESFVREEVQRLTNLLATKTAAQSPVGEPAGEMPVTEKQLIAEKQPNGHSEIVAVLAYFLTKNGQTEFSAEDFRRAYARASVRPPKVMAQALRDAKNLNDYLEVGSKRGSFRLSPHGERTVAFDLPKKHD